MIRHADNEGEERETVMTKLFWQLFRLQTAAVILMAQTNQKVN